MNNIIKHTDFITQIKVPLPFPLKWVNSYLIRGNQGYTLIDPGLHTEAAEECWVGAMEQLKITFREIAKIVLTHHHPDHYGLSGWFQQRSNAPVYLSELSYSQALRLWGADSTLTNELHWLYLRHGMESSLADQMIPHMNGFMPLVSPQPKVIFMEEEHSINLGDSPYRIIMTHGHASGHLCFYNEHDGVMFCGDQVIPQISPNVSYIPGGDLNPLHSFLASLHRLAAYEVSKAYPGHREPFSTFTERIQEIIDHHDQRLLKIMDHMKQPITAYELCIQLFGNKLPIHQLRFAMSETLAHTIYLLKSGKIKEQEYNGIMMYQGSIS